MVDQPGGLWHAADAKKPTGVGLTVGSDLTNVPLLEPLSIAPELPKRAVIQAKHVLDEQNQPMVEE